MTPDYFTSKWFMTVFSCFLPYVLIEQIFDMFLLEGWRAVFRIGVALLKVLEPELLKMDNRIIVTFTFKKFKSMLFARFAVRPSNWDES